MNRTSNVIVVQSGELAAAFVDAFEHESTDDVQVNEEGDGFHVCFETFGLYDDILQGLCSGFPEESMDGTAFGDWGVVTSWMNDHGVFRITKKEYLLE